MGLGSTKTGGVYHAIGAAQIGHIALEAQEYYSDVLFGLRNVRGTWDTVNDLLAAALVGTARRPWTASNSD